MLSPFFCSEVLLELALYFFLELNMVLRAHVVLCMTEPNFLKIMFCPQNGENRPSLRFFECIGKFSFFSQFFSFFLNLEWNEIMKVYFAIMKVYITVIAVCLNNLHSWENFGSWDMGKMLLANQSAGFFNQSQDSKTGSISRRN